MLCFSLMNQTLSLGWCLSIRDYKCPLLKGLVKCPYLLGSEESTLFVSANRYQIMWPDLQKTQHNGAIYFYQYNNSKNALYFIILPRAITQWKKLRNQNTLVPSCSPSHEESKYVNSFCKFWYFLVTKFVYVC